jgi:hypothetical protein
MDQACNSSYLGETEVERITIQGQPRQKDSETPITTNGWVQWHTPIFPATQGSINIRIASRLT